MKRAQVLLMKLIAVAVGLFFLVKVQGQDSLNLRKYYTQPIISRFEFLVGPSLVAMRGVNQQFEKFGTTKVGYSIGIGINQRLARHFEIDERILWERKGYKEASSFFLTTLIKITSLFQLPRRFF